MMGIAEVFLSNGFAVLVPDSRAQVRVEATSQPTDEVPLAGHCGAVNTAGQEFDTRVLGWFRSHDGGYSAAPPQS
jgi:hypothetical protein